MAITITLRALLDKNLMRLIIVFGCLATFVSNTYAESAFVESELRAESNFTSTAKRYDLGKALRQQQTLGVDVPPSLISAISKLDPEDSVRRIQLGQWLNWLAEEPEKLGLSVFRNEPLIAGAVSNIEQIVTLGSPVVTGGGFLVTKHWEYPVVLQTKNKDDPNYVSLRALNTDIKLEISAHAFSGIHGGLEQEIDHPYFQLVEGDLQVGDKVIVEYRNLTLPTKATKNFSLPLYSRLSETDELFQIPEKRLTINGGALAEVSLIVPTLIRAGISFQTKVFLNDEYGNPAKGRFPSFDILINGVFFKRLNAGIINQHLLEDLKIDYGTDTQIEIRSSGGGISASANPFTFVNTRKQIYWGDTRSHTSIGIGDESAVDPSLDFVIPATRSDFLNSMNWGERPGPKSWVWEKALEKGGRHQIISDWYQRDIAFQSALVGKMLSEKAVVIGSGAAPIDDRFINNKQWKYIELLSNTSRFESFANRLLNRGYRLSFAASNQSELIPLGPRLNAALTAVIAREGEDWFTAFSNGRTYVTSGQRLLMDITVNGAFPGERIPIVDERIIEGRVKGTAGIHKVELIKNGEVIDSTFFSAVPEGEAPHLLKVTFFSDSAPYREQRDLPRNGREWLGYFSSEARIKEVIAPGFLDSARQGLAQSGGNRVDFITWTRGSHSGFLVDLENVDEDTVFEVNLKGGHEDIDVSPRTRAASKFPAIRQMIPYFDLLDGAQLRKFKVNGYEDEISLEFVNPATSNNAAFRFVDKSVAKEGDYYYIRVQQLDDQMAWSSPVFVGGFDQP
ncbi:MAG: hypothetical protein ACI9FB_003247 [Candidatus Azotimanducaceae bacterium]